MKDAFFLPPALAAVAALAGLAVGVVGVTGCGAQVLDVGENGRPGATGAPPGTTPEQGNDPAAWFPSSACTPVGATAKQLVPDEPYVSFRNIVPDGAHVLFDAYDNRLQGYVPRLRRVATAGGPAVDMTFDGYRGVAGFHQGRMVFLRTLHEGTATKEDPRREEVALRDPATGIITSVPNPRATTYVAGIRVHASGVFWLAREWDAMTPLPISRWNAGAATELTTIDNYSGMATDGRDVFYVRWDVRAGGANEIRIEAVPIAGGTPRVLRRYPYDRKWHYGVVATDDAELYFTQESTTDGGTIGDGDLRAMKKDGTGERVLATGVRFGTAGLRVDPDYVTWNDQAAQNDIVRVPRKGGALERLPGPPNRWVTAIAVDTCNLYWSVENPPALYARSRVP